MNTSPIPYIAILASCLLSGIPSVRASPAGDFEYKTEANSIIITRYSGEDQVVTIPDKIAGLPVRKIDKFAFRTSKLTSVKIPDGITEVSGVAFTECRNLSSVTVPGSLTWMGRFPFAAIESLTNISVTPANPTYSSLDGVLFDKAGTTLIRFPAGKKGSYVIPGNVTMLGDNAFHRSVGLTSVNIPFSIPTITRHQFYDCKNLTQVTITPGVVNIQSFAFAQCSSLPTISIPASVTSIEGMAFSGCSALTSAIFEGDAPLDSKKYPTAFRDTAPDFKIHYFKGSVGFTTPEWNGYKTVEIDPSTAFISWTSPDGRTIRGKFLKLSGESVMLEKEDGNQVTIPFAKLAPASVVQARRMGASGNSK